MKASLCKAAKRALAILFAGSVIVGQGVGAQPAKSGINKDAMTMQDCRDRLALPKAKRRESDDKRVDLDGICKNMLSAKEAPTATAAQPSSSRPRA